MKTNKSLIISVLVMGLGLLMLVGTSYSLIRKTSVTNNSYGLSVGDIKVDFNGEENNITLENGVPISDSDGIKGDKEFTFVVSNTGDYTANYSIAIDETSVEKIGKVIKYSYSLNDSNYIVPKTIEESNYINQNVILEQGKSDTYKIKVWLDIDADASYMGKEFTAKITLSSTQNDYKYASSVVDILGKDNKDGVKLINNNYYYTSGNNNYVWFNCDDGYTKGINHCERWQIIGTFDNSWENGINNYKVVKIINPQNSGKIKYNDFVNKLNVDYYNDLKLSAKDMLLNGKWDDGRYLEVGMISENDYTNIKDWLVIDNLMFYPNNEYKGIIDKNITSLDENGEYNYLSSVYLKPDVSIIDGYGTLDNPYELSIKFPMSYNEIGA